MIIKNNKRYRDDFISIVNYIKDSEKVIDYYDFLNFVCSFEYYRVFYENYMIFNDLILYHNNHLNENHEVNNYSDNDTFNDLVGF